MKTMNGQDRAQQVLQYSRPGTLSLRPPFVTVIVTNYNYEQFVVPCLESIAGQSYPHYKCIVVDDRSTDRSVEVIEAFIRSDRACGKFELLRSEKNGGQMAAFKAGIEKSEGAFTVLVDADDLLYEDFLDVHLRAHLHSLPVAFTCSNQMEITESNEIQAGTNADLQAEIISRRGSLSPLKDKGEEYRHVIPALLDKPFWVWATTSSMMFRSDVLKLIVPDDCESFRICADNYICHFANLLGGSLLMESVHGCYRRHGRNGFGRNPIVGGQHPTGNMENHPRHKIVKRSIRGHLLARHEVFSSVLSGGGFVRTLARVADPAGMMKLAREHPEYFADKDALFYVRVVSLFYYEKIKKLIRNAIKSAVKYYRIIKNNQ